MKQIKMGIVAAVLSVALQATEGGGGAYPNGAEGMMAGAVPPPGLYYINYLTNYSADKVVDQRGDVVLDGLGLSATVNVSRIVYTTDWRLLGADYAMQVLIPVVDLQIRAFKSLPGGSRDSGLGDILVTPFVLAWHSPRLHQVVGLDMILPTGAYDKNHAVNVGRNYYTFTPVYAVTYISEGGFEYSGKFMYDLNTQNSATKYRSGQEFHVDYTLAQHAGSFGFGLGGYYYQQVTGDSGSATSDNRGRVLALGPTLGYDYANIHFIAKYHVETNVANKPKGKKAWLKVIYAF